MPLFKNKKPEEKVEKEIKKEDYEPQRKTRFEPGHIAKAFIPQPDVVCFPKLSSYPPLITPPPPPSVIEETPPAPKPPKISEKSPKPPPPPKIGAAKETEETAGVQENVEIKIEMDQTQQMDANMMSQYYADYNNMMYPQMYEYAQNDTTAAEIPASHTMPLLPPPLPPNEPEDDLALLGICADDMAAQTF